MKTYAQLTKAQREVAVERSLNEFLVSVCEGSIELEGSLGEMVDKAVAKADRNMTPWFVGEFIMETCGEDFKAIAKSLAKERLYAEEGDPKVVYGVA